MKPTTGPIVLFIISLAGAVAGLYTHLSSPSSDWFRRSWYVLGVSLPLAGAMGHLLTGDAVRSQLGWQSDGAGGFQRELGLVLLALGSVSLLLALRDATDENIRLAGFTLGAVYGVLFLSHVVNIISRTAVEPVASGIAGAADLLASFTLIIGSYEVVTG